MNRNRFPYHRTPLFLAALAALALSGLGLQCDTRQPQDLTILLVEYRGPEATATAERLAKELGGQGLKDVFVVNGPEVTSLCVGHFASWKDPEADKQKNIVHQVRDASGQNPFRWARLVPMPQAAPKNEWPLDGAKGVYTLHVATCGIDMVNREAAAQVYAGALRAKGFEAYVYHGPRFSMVTIGGFGPNIFDDPTKVGVPGVKPEVVDPQVLELIKRFPTMKLDGQDTIMPTSLVKIPGREPPPPAAFTTKAMYRIAVRLVDTKTGLAVPRGEAGGVAQARDEVPALLVVLVQQLQGCLPKDKPSRVGLVGVLATDPDAAGQKADRYVTDGLAGALDRAAKETKKGMLAVSAADATAQVLDAAGLKPVDVLRDARKAQGVAGLDYLVTGTVTVIPAR